MSLKPMLIVSDAHRPYHDRAAWRLMMKAAEFLKPRHITVIGDFADFYAVSSHDKDPSRALSLPKELANVRVGLGELDRLGAETKDYVEGNHENRLTRYLTNKAPELFGMVSVPELLDLEARGWSFTPYKHHRKVGKLHQTHDVGVAGRYSTFKALDTYQHTVITGHAHRMQYLVEGNAVGEHKLAAQFGWLGDVNAIDYMHRAKALKDWALGFGVGHIHEKTGVAYLVPVPIVRVKGRYTCVVNGRYFEVPVACR